MSEETVAASDIDDAPSATQTPYSPRGFPCFEKLLARQATGVANRTRQPMKERVVWKAAQIVVGQASS
jgi:hypothetical protein